MKEIAKPQSLAFIAVAIAITVAIALLPWHMDEYVMFHSLACWDPLQSLNTYRESCPGNPTSLGNLSYYRSYAYIGIASSLLMAPLHFIFPSLAANSLSGILWVGLAGLGITKSLKLNWKYAGIIYLYFPISYSLIHDGGPIRLSLLTICWIPYLFDRLQNQRRCWAKMLIWLLIFGLWVGSVEDKPFFMYLVPGSYFFVLACIKNTSEPNGQHRKIIDITSIFALNSFLSVGLLYFMKAGEEPYLVYLRKNSPDWSQRISELGNSLRFFMDWPYFSFRITEWSRLALLGSIGSCALISLLAFIFIRKEQKNIFLNGGSGILALSCVTFWFFSWIAGGKFNHHFVFAQIPLMAALMQGIAWESKKITERATMLSLLTLASAISLLSVIVAPKVWYASSNTNNIIEKSLANNESQVILNSSNWGIYYAYSLAGHRGNPVVWADTTESMNHLEKFARGTNREIIHLCWNCNEDIVRYGYPNSNIMLTNKNSSGWKAYAISDPRR